MYCRWALNRVKESCSNSGNSVNDDRNRTRTLSEPKFIHINVTDTLLRSATAVVWIIWNFPPSQSHREGAFHIITCSCTRRSWRLRIETNSKFDSVSPSTRISTGGMVLCISSCIVDSVLLHMCVFGCASCNAVVEATLVRRLDASQREVRLRWSRIFGCSFLVWCLS